MAQEEITETGSSDEEFAADLALVRSPILLSDFINYAISSVTTPSETEKPAEEVSDCLTKPVVTSAKLPKNLPTPLAEDDLNDVVGAPSTTSAKSWKQVIEPTSKPAKSLQFCEDVSKSTEVDITMNDVASCPTKLMDRISNLPDSILSNILSYLPTQAAVRTRIFGRQWRNIWFPINEKLVFHQTCEHVNESYLKGIAKFIYIRLPLDTCPKITKLELKLKESSSYFSKEFFHLVLKFAILRHVRDIDLDVEGVILYKYYDSRNYEYDFSKVLSKRLRSYASLERLTLRHIEIISNLKFYWTSLKALTISSSRVRNEVIMNIFEGCPKLDQFELNDCYEYTQIFVKPTSCLRKLIIIERNEISWQNDRLLYIWIPKVECLVLKILESVQLLCISSVIDVSMDFYSLKSDPCFKDVSNHYKKMRHLEIDRLFRDEDYKDLKDRRDIFMELLNKVAHVEILRLSPWCVKVVTSYILRGLPLDELSSLNCKRLVLETPVEEWDILGILGLLRKSPHLETLIIDLTTGDDYTSKFSIGTKVAATNANTFWKKQSNFSEQFPKHLKDVKIIGLSVRLVGFAKYLLENAMFLEKMIVAKSSTKDDPSVIIERILNLPKASPNAQILIL